MSPTRILAAAILAAGAATVQAADDNKVTIENRIAQCQGCHGIRDWKTAFPEVYHVPKLGGQKPAYIVAALKAYRSGERDFATMKAIAANLSDADIEAVARYYGGELQTSAAATPAAAHGPRGPRRAGRTRRAGHGARVQCHQPGRPGREEEVRRAMNRKLLALALVSLAFPVAASSGDAEVGKKKSAPCAVCHGANGVSVSAEFPNLAGQYEDYLDKALHHYKNGKRKNPIMAGQVANLSEKDMSDLSAYFASQGALQVKH